MRRQAGAVALLGALLVLTSDFAGWYTRQTGLGVSSSPSRTGSAAQDLFFSYSASDSSDAINIWGPYLPLLLVVVALLGMTGYLALRTPPSGLPMNAPLWMMPAAAAAATLVFGLIFLVAMLIADPDDWWLDVGFFAGLIGGGSRRTCCVAWAPPSPLSRSAARGRTRLARHDRGHPCKGAPR